ncbi:hypothetical protein [Halorubrum sp. CBA1229]|uniref:hypothetical protein n=1 Tax=Halorubrum sp. CBA1229 TaxID=1853699 RepID=UPI000F3D4E09|nr:hypothetical protein [Halorubrum sp. CBA1229]QKY16414.1 hypothetical protein Hrr1229_005800 [Halorubrum sp. CBA1229]
MVSIDLPTQEEFEKAQEAADNDNHQDVKAFYGFSRIEEFDDYTEFMSYVAAKKAASASSDAFETKCALDNYEHYGKILLLAIGAGALVEAVIGDARF